MGGPAEKPYEEVERALRADVRFRNAALYCHLFHQDVVAVLDDTPERFLMRMVAAKIVGEEIEKATPKTD